MMKSIVGLFRKLQNGIAEQNVKVEKARRDVLKRRDSNGIDKLQLIFAIVPGAFKRMCCLKLPLGGRIALGSRRLLCCREYSPLIKWGSCGAFSRVIVIGINNDSRDLSHILAKVMYNFNTLDIDPELVARVIHTKAMNKETRSRLFYTVDKVTRSRPKRSSEMIMSSYVQLLRCALNQPKDEIEIISRLQRADFLHLTKSAMDEDLDMNRLSDEDHGCLMNLFHRLVDRFDLLDELEIIELLGSRREVEAQSDRSSDNSLAEIACSSHLISASRLTKDKDNDGGDGDGDNGRHGQCTRIGVYRQLFLSELSMSDQSSTSLSHIVGCMPTTLITVITEYDVVRSNDEVFRRLTSRSVYGCISLDAFKAEAGKVKS